MIASCLAQQDAGPRRLDELHSQGVLKEI